MIRFMSLLSIISALHLAQSSDFTIVTAFFEIGRENWTTYRRSTQEYLKNMEFVLMLDVNMVIFIEEQHVSFVEQLRNRWYPNKTVIEIISLSDLPLSKYRVKMQNVLDNEQDDWLPYWDKRFKDHPEAVYADYDIIMNSKPYFLQRAAQGNKFDSEWFVWLDAGYGHGDRSLFPEDFRWTPDFSKFHNNKVIVPTFLTANELQEIEIHANIFELYRKNIALIAGGFIAVHKTAIEKYDKLYFEMVTELLEMNIVDDDQTINALMLATYPNLFQPFHGDWFDALIILPSK